MASKLLILDKIYLFQCPGCSKPHPFDERWTFNGDMEKPTFRPSLLVNKSNHPGELRCHSFVTNGEIRFLSDCDHDLKNKIVEIPDWEDEFF